jgi:ribosomal small subunit protein bTHX
MGKGDRRTRKGKISIRSYGNKRSHTETKVATVAKATTPAKPAVKKAATSAAKKKA